jgi:hypothetical protein
MPERHVLKGDSMGSGADQADGSQEENERSQHGRSTRGSNPSFDGRPIVWILAMDNLSHFANGSIDAAAFN